MKQILEYLLSKQTTHEQHAKIQDEEYGDWTEDFGLKFHDDKKPRFDKKGKAYLWWKFWSILKTDGPMSKKELLRKLKLKETSYGTMFTDLSIMNIIVYNTKTRKLEPIDPSEWKVNKRWIENKSTSPWSSGWWEYYK